MTQDIIKIAVPVFILLIVIISILFFSIKLKNNRKTQEINCLEKNQVSQEEVGLDVVVLDNYGHKVIETREISKIPVRSHSLQSSSSAIDRVKHLTADLFKGASSVPNKTIEVIFKPEIQKGLSEGTHTLMKTKSGEVLADAVDSTGKVAGKGRLVEGGKARQLASGAFQLVSIAVAQSHLADIERSLGAIKSSISEILGRIENEDQAKIEGAFKYLEEIACYMKDLKCPDSISQQKRNAIETVIKDSYAWQSKLEKDVASLIEEIRGLKDLDTFGTGATYEKLKEMVEKIKPLLKRRELLINLASATNFVTAYIDPTQNEFSRIKPSSDKWINLIDEFKTISVEKSQNSLSKAMFNSGETLQLRKDKILSLTRENHAFAFEQQRIYENIERTLEDGIRNLIGSDGGVHIAVSYDEKGEIKEAAIV